MFEYTHESASYFNLQEILDLMAERNWELVSVTEDCHSNYTLFWKRKKS